MQLCKSGQISNCCHPNALMTLKEYSQDYAGDDTKLKADNLIMKELDNITSCLLYTSGVIIVKNKKKQNKSNEAVKTAGNNQWTNNNTKYYPDERERQDGPGGN